MGKKTQSGPMAPLSLPCFYKQTCMNKCYYSFKLFPLFWLGKITRIIHHNQPLNVILSRWPRKAEDEGELSWLFEQNGGTVGRTLYSLHGEILSKNIARTARGQLNGQHLLFGVYLQTWADLYLLNFPKKMHYRCELNMDQGKHF